MRVSMWALVLAAGLTAACEDEQAAAEEEAVDGLEEARKQLEPVIKASCDWVFTCCTAGEARLSLGPFVADTADCTVRVLDSLLAGNKSPAPGLSVGPATDILYVARSLELGRVTLDEEAMAACVAYLDARECNEPPPEEPPVPKSGNA